jgi:hypothetical protein
MSANKEDSQHGKFRSAAPPKLKGERMVKGFVKMQIPYKP